MNQVELFEAINKDLTFFEIVPSLRALGEDGKYIESEDGEPVGYALVNTATDIVEHTSTYIAGIFFQAQHFENTLKSLTATKDDPDTIAVDGDVIPLLQ